MNVVVFGDRTCEGKVYYGLVKPDRIELRSSYTRLETKLDITYFLHSFLSIKQKARRRANRKKAFTFIGSHPCLISKHGESVELIVFGTTPYGSIAQQKRIGQE